MSSGYAVAGHRFYEGCRDEGRKLKETVRCRRKRSEKERGERILDRQDDYQLCDR